MGVFSYAQSMVFVIFSSVMRYLKTNHIGLPALSVDTAIDAPPEVVLRLPLPGKYSHT